MSKRIAWIGNEPNGRNINNRHDVHTAVFEKPQNPPWTKYIEFSEFQKLLTEYDERAEAMRDTGNVVRSLFVPYLRRIKEALGKPVDDLDVITEIAGIIKELEAHTSL